MHLAGEDCRPNTKGMYLITTNSASPFASGQWMMRTGTTKSSSLYRRDPFQEQIDEWGKLEGEFNNAGDHSQNSDGFRPTIYDWSHLNQIENVFMEPDKTRLDLNDDMKIVSSSTERWRQNDKFILAENPLGELNDTLPHHSQTLANDDFQFPKVSYRK